MLASTVVLTVESQAKEHAITKTPHVNTSQWTRVALPFRPISIAASGNAMWVCGANESIASSLDGGASWQMKHQRQFGELLLTVSFIDSKTGFAAGTGGILLSTLDGGETWSTHQAGSTIKQFSFSDAKHGIAETGEVVKLTDDGGDTWHELDALRNDEKVRPFSQIESVAALDPSHFAVALHQPQGENIILSTIDGGKSWVPLHIDNTFAGTLVVRDGKYWAFGIEYLGREHDPSGGYSAPVALYSNDGRTWQHGIRATTEFDGCNVQGCFLAQGVIEVLFDDTEKIWSLPQNHSTTPNWAMALGKTCIVSNELECGSAIESDAPQPPSKNSGPRTFQVQNRPLVEGCVACHLVPFKPDPDLPARPFAAKDVRVLLIVKRDGTIGRVSVEGVPGKRLSGEISEQISDWLIAPKHDGSGTTEAHYELRFVLSCFPDFPGHPGSGNCTVISPNQVQEHAPTVIVSQ
jgi:hypothetical protein